MVSFIDICKAEILKNKRTKNLIFLLLLPFVVSAIILGYYITKLSGITSERLPNQWFEYSRGVFVFYYLIYPFFAAIIAYASNSIEYKNGGFKQIFTFPVKKLYVYLGKLTVLFLWMFASLLLAYLLLIAEGYLLDFLYPKYGFDSFTINKMVLVFFVRNAITLFTIILIHFFLSFYWESFVASIGTASFLIILGLIAAKWKYSFLLPYSSLQKTITMFSNKGSIIFTKEMYWCLGYAVLFLLLGCLLLERKKVN